MKSQLSEEEESFADQNDMGDDRKRDNGRSQSDVRNNCFHFIAKLLSDLMDSYS